MAALTALTSNLMEILGTNRYVHLIALDFSKAFDTVRHSSLAAQLAGMQIPDCIYNWIMVFMEDRATELSSTVSYLLLLILTQALFGLRPINFILTASKLKTIHFRKPDTKTC